MHGLDDVAADREVAQHTLGPGFERPAAWRHLFSEAEPSELGGPTREDASRPSKDTLNSRSMADEQLNFVAGKPVKLPGARIDQEFGKRSADADQRALALHNDAWSPTTQA